MLKHNQVGSVAIVLVVTLLVVLLAGSIAFGAWAFSSREDYKNNVDAKIATAVAAAKQQQMTADSAQYNEEAKQPLRAYNGPEAYGSLVVNYPKTWSSYVDDSGSGNALVDGYFAPNTVPSLTAQGSVFALRVQVVQQSYSQTIQNFNNEEQSGQLSAAQAFALPKVPKVIGVEVSGTLPNGSNGTMIVLPLRNETLQIWTDGNQYLNDFNKYILPNFSFSP